MIDFVDRRETMRPGLWKLVATSLLGVLALFGLYMGSFYCMPAEGFWNLTEYSRTPGTENHGTVVCARVLEYKFGGAFSEYFFRPACAVDRLLRPSQWQETFIGDLRQWDIPPE